MNLHHCSRRILVATLLLSCVRPGIAQESAKDILAMSPEQLVDVLKNAEAPLFDKAKAAQRLAVVGDQSAVPALAYVKYVLAGLWVLLAALFVVKVFTSQTVPPSMQPGLWTPDISPYLAPPAPKQPA